MAVPTRLHDPPSAPRPAGPHRAVPAGVGLAVLALALAACAAGSTAVAPLPPPPSTSSLPPPTTPVDRSGMALPAVDRGPGPTTSLPMGPGTANLNGRVLAPDGTPMADANIRVERLVGSAVATMDLLSGADGGFALPGLLGGAYRVRAWRSPDLGIVEPHLLFIGATNTGMVEIKLERHLGTTPLPSVAPLRPIVGALTNIVVQLSNRSVDGAGLIQGTPLAGVAVALDGGVGWTVLQPNPTVADASGRARWQLVCAATGVQPMRLVVNDVEQFQLALPACADPPTPPPSTVAPGSTTTATTRAGVATTTRPPTTAAPTTTTRPGNRPRP